MDGPDGYRERILDHDRNPRNKRWLRGADFEAHGSNPVCGDDVMVQVKLEGGLLADVAFSGRGCAISQAAASILTEVAKGRPLEWVEKSSDEDIFRMLGIGEHRKARVPCELLGIRALKNGASTYNDSRPSTPR